MTTSEDYVFDSFDAFPVHYLLKEETTEEKFEQVFLRAVRLTCGDVAKKFVCQSGRAKKIIPIKEISYFDIWKGVVTVHYGQGKTFKYWITMDVLEEQLRDKNFIRTHRSYIINLQYISKFERRTVLLKTGESIPVGVTYEEKVKSTFIDFMALV